MSAAGTFILTGLILSQLSSLQWEGPDLGATGPIIAIAALRQFWRTYGAILLLALLVVALLLMSLWIVLEALFRGGWKHLWLYVGTSAARWTLLLGTAGIFGLLSTQDETGGTVVIGVAVVAGLWFIVGILETLVRRDAVDLLATSLVPLSVVMGSLLLIEAALGFVLLSSAAIALLKSAYIGLGGVFALVVVVLWMFVHSYLLAVRYSAIDIMRRNVFRA